MPTPRAVGGVDRRTFMGPRTALGIGGSGLPAARWTASRTRRAPADRQAPGKSTEEMLTAVETVDAEHQTKPFDDKALEVLKGLGVQPIPIDLPVGPLRIILSSEAAAAFDEITRSNQDDQMVQQTRNPWPNSVRTSRFIPAVEYIQANRIRTLLMRKMAELMRTVDVFVTPSFGGNVLLTTNLTGHPAVVLPNGFSEAQLLAVAEPYQSATDFHQQPPQKFS